MTDDKPYREFWIWFIENSDMIWNFETNQEEIFDRLQYNIQKIHPSLIFEIGSEVDTHRDFVISADGVKDAFPHVKKLHELAPHNKDWNFLAFRQRQDPQFSINIGGYSVSAEKVYFELLTNGELIGIDLYFELDSFIEEKQLRTIAFLFLDGIIGEYDVETKVGQIDIKTIAIKDKKKSIRPIVELPEAFDKLWNRISN